MRSIIRLLLAAILVTGSAYTYANPHSTVKVNASRIEDRHLTGFHAIELGGSFDVYITQGASESVKVEAPDDVIGHVITEVKDGVLKIHSKDENGFHFGDIFNHKKVVVYVNAKDLNSLSVSGSGDMFFKDGIHANELKLRVGGSGDMTGRVDVKILESSVSGSGDMKLSGRAESSRVSVGGSGDYAARGLVTENTSVRVSGSGDASVNASGSINASVSGSGDIRYTGSPKNVSSAKSGSGDIERD